MSMTPAHHVSRVHDKNDYIANSIGKKARLVMLLLVNGWKVVQSSTLVELTLMLLNKQWIPLKQIFWFSCHFYITCACTMQALTLLKNALNDQMRLASRVFICKTGFMSDKQLRQWNSLHKFWSKSKFWTFRVNYFG